MTKKSIRYKSLASSLICASRFLSCRVLYQVFVLVLLLVSRPKHQCLGLVPIPPEGNSNSDCRPADIKLYTWSGPGFESGECWHQGYRFLNGFTWGRMDIPGAPYCVCEYGHIRIFYSQSPVDTHSGPDSLTLLRTNDGSLPTAKDLAKWPIPNVPTIQQRTMLCSFNKLGARVRSRDGCTGCKCSKDGHWLCRRPPSSKNNKTKPARQMTHHQQQQLSMSRSTPYSYSDASNSINDQHQTTSVRARPQCPLGTQPKFCILIERLLSSNTSEKSSRYIEIPRATSWIDHDTCTRCSCTLEGHFKCEFLRETCTRPCLVQKTRPISVMYYFPSGSKWIAPPNDKCHSCTCNDGQRRCMNCDQVLQIDIKTNRILKNSKKKQKQKQMAVGEYRLQPSKPSSSSAKTKPCLLQLSASSHRLILPGQETWLNNRCYFCSMNDARLISC